MIIHNSLSRAHDMINLPNIQIINIQLISVIGTHCGPGAVSLGELP
jgi:fatty acid-binding protein DegV